MSKNSKIIVGLFSFLPIVLLVVFFILFLRVFPAVFEWENYEPAPQEVLNVFGPIIILAIIMGIISLGLFVFFIIHLVRQQHMDSVEKIIWILVFIFASIVGFPIYWYMRVWKTEIDPL